MAKLSTPIYSAWRSAQHEKYADVYPKIKAHLRNDMTVLDFGVGPAWFEEFLRGKGLEFKRIVGVDPDAGMTKPQKEYIEYKTSLGDVKEKFDLVIAFDSAHLSDGDLMEHVKEEGFLLASVPLKFRAVLNNPKGNVIAQGEIGKTEKDQFVFIKKA